MKATSINSLNVVYAIFSRLSLPDVTSKYILQFSNSAPGGAGQKQAQGSRKATEAFSVSVNS